MKGGSIVGIWAAYLTAYNSARLSSNDSICVNNCLYISHDNHMVEKYSHCPHIPDEEMKALPKVGTGYISLEHR